MTTTRTRGWRFNGVERNSADAWGRMASLWKVSASRCAMSVSPVGFGCTLSYVCAGTDHPRVVSAKVIGELTSESSATAARARALYWAILCDSHGRKASVAWSTGEMTMRTVGFASRAAAIQARRY